MKTLITLSAMFLLSGCATNGVKLCDNFEGARCISAEHESFVNNPRAVQAHLEKTVPAARLKRWKRALSDDKLVFQFDPVSGSGSAY